MDIQVLRNLTTGRLHTEVADIYEAIEFFISEPGIMTHQIPSAMTALRPFLQEQFTDPRLWDDQYDPSHVGEVEAVALNEEQLEKFWYGFRVARSKDPF